MPAAPYRVEIESMHWPTLLPVVHLFRSFSQAVHPAKLLLAFVLVLLLYLGGWGLDLGLGPVAGDEMRGLVGQLGGSPWASSLARRRAAGAGRGVFETAAGLEVEAFRGFLRSILELDPGVDELLSPRPGRRGAGGPGGRWPGGAGAVGPLYVMFVVTPRWLLYRHPWFVAIYGAYAFFLFTFFGGALSRMAGLHAAQDIRIPPTQALRFAAGKYVWFVLGPLIPPALAGALVIVQALLGLILFNWPITDIIGGVIYPVFLLGGFVVTLIAIGLAAGVHLVAPSIAVEGTDAFDALSRAYNYVLGRPWRFLFYVFLALVYFAVTYLFIELVVLGTIWCTRQAVGLGVFMHNAAGVERFEAITGGAPAGGSSGIAAGVVSGWVGLLALAPFAFAVSFYFCASTWIYLLLRRAADGVELNDIDAAPTRDEAAEASGAEGDAAPEGDGPGPSAPPSSGFGDA